MLKYFFSLLFVFLFNWEWVCGQQQKVHEFINKAYSDVILHENNNSKKSDKSITIVDTFNPYDFRFTDNLVQKAKHIKLKHVGISNFLSVSDSKKNVTYLGYPTLYLFNADTMAVVLTGYSRCDNREGKWICMSLRTLSFCVYDNMKKEWESLDTCLINGQYARKMKEQNIIEVDSLIKVALNQCLKEIVYKNGYIDDKVYYVAETFPAYFFVTYFDANRDTNSIAYVQPTNLFYVPSSKKISKYKKDADWFVGYPQISLDKEKMTISISFFRSKDYSKKKLPKLIENNKFSVDYNLKELFARKRKGVLNKNSIL